MPPGDCHLERHRGLLHLQVRQLRLDPRLRPRFDSDLLPNALLKPRQKRDQADP